MFEIKYTVKVTLLIKKSSAYEDLMDTFTKNLDLPEDKLYGSFQELQNGYILDILKDKVESYLKETNLTINDIEVDSYEVISNTEGVQVFFENPYKDSEFTLSPIIKAYIPPKVVAIEEPILKGKALDTETIVWSFESSSVYAHYLLDDKDKVIAEVPINVDHYIETKLSPSTTYTRKLVSYDASGSSKPSANVSITTNERKPNLNLKNYNEKRNETFDKTLVNTENTKITAFHSGTGDEEDLFVSKEPYDFHEKFSMNINISGVNYKKKTVYDAIDFKYKIHAKAEYNSQEQNGDIDLILHAYPVEHINYRIYKYGLKPIKANYRVTCKVLFYSIETTTSTDKDGKTVTTSKLTPHIKNIMSDSYEFTFLSEASLKVDENGKSFAVCDYIRFSKAQIVSSKTLIELVTPSINNDTEITSESTKSNIPYEVFDFQIENDYPFDEIDNRWNSSAARDFGSGIRGTLKTSAASAENGLDKNSLVYAYGFSEGCLYDLEQYIESEISYIEGQKTTLKKSDIPLKNLVNIVDAFQYLDAVDKSIVTDILTQDVEKDIVVDSLDKTGTEDIISSCHMVLSSMSEITSDKLSYKFTKDSPYSAIKAALAINIGQGEYIFVPEILATSGNVDLGLNKNVTVGQQISYRGSKDFCVGLFANLVDVTNTWESTFPLLHYLTGTVNKGGKNDLTVTMPEFPVPKYIDEAKVKYSIEITEVSKADAIILAKFSNSDNNNFGIVNGDEVTFSSVSTYDENDETIELLGNVTEAALELVDTFEKEFQFKIIKPTLKAEQKYDKYILNISSDNMNLALFYEDEVNFDEKSEGTIKVTVKAIQGATSYLRPRINNGYYYINNDEYFLYSSFDASEVLAPNDALSENKYFNFMSGKCILYNILPKQFAPIIVEDDVLGSLRHSPFYDENNTAILTNTETFISKSQKNFRLAFINIDPKTLVVKINNEICDKANYNLYNNILEFNSLIIEGVSVFVSYMLKNSFCVNYDIYNKKITIETNTDSPIEKGRIMYETSVADRKKTADNLSLNPIYNLESNGFIYISYDSFDLKDFNIYINPKTLKADGKDNCSVYIFAKDVYNNPAPSCSFTMSCKYGKLSENTAVTDMNGVICIRYTSSSTSCTDSISVTAANGSTKTVDIINE